MKACLDTYYLEQSASTGVVLFENWDDPAPAAEQVFVRPTAAEEYVPGEFFRRELPCLLEALEPFLSEVKTCVVDGYVWLDSEKRKGLGAHLFDALGGKISVVGVAKKAFHGNVGRSVFRGTSQRPLFVTSAGVDEDLAARKIARMAGSYRIPDLIKRADQLSRQGDIGEEE